MSVEYVGRFSSTEYFHRAELDIMEDRKIPMFPRPFIAEVLDPCQQPDFRKTTLLALNIRGGKYFMEILSSTF